MPEVSPPDLAKVCDTRASSVHFEDTKVSVDGSSAKTKVIQATITDTGVRLTVALAQQLFAAWMALKELPHYRCRAGDVVTAYDPGQQRGWWYDRITEAEEVLGAIAPDKPNWLTALDGFVDRVEVEEASA